MKFTAKIARENSLQPLLVIFAVILLPVVFSTHMSAAPFIHAIAPDLGSQQTRLVQLIVSLVLIGIGVFVWRFGSKKAVLRALLAYTVLSTLILGTSLLFLVIHLQSYGSAQAIMLMKDGLVIWWMTALTFSLWYWLLDSGWAESMGMRDTVRQDFVFAQQVNDFRGWEGWKPNFVEYMYLGFNTNTAFSPTDVAPLSHRAKILMMLQSTLALVIVGTVVARAVNILAG